MLLLVPTVATTDVVDRVPLGVGVTEKVAVDLSMVRVMTGLISSSMSISAESLTCPWEGWGMKVRRPMMRVKRKQDRNTRVRLMAWWGFCIWLL